MTVQEKIRSLIKGEYACIIYRKNGDKHMAQGYVRYVDSRYVILGMGFRDDWVNIEKDAIEEITSKV